MLVLCASSSLVMALNAPVATFERLQNNQIQASFSLSDAAEGFNVFFNGAYKSTHRATAQNSFTFTGGAGNYCLSSFATVNNEKQYSPCSNTSFVADDNSATSGANTASTNTVQNFRATLYSSTAAELFWESPANFNAKQFRLYRNNSLLSTLDGKSYFEASLQANQTYNYKIIAVAQDNTESAETTLQLNTADFGRQGTTNANQGSSNNNQSAAVPPTPSGFTGTVYSATAAELFWAAADSSDAISAYEVFRDGELVHKTTGRSYFDGARQNGVRYLYELKAVNANGTRSAAATLQLGSPVQAQSVSSLKQNDFFSIAINTERYALQEGDTAGVHIPISLNRKAGYTRGIDLSIRVENASDLSAIQYSFEPASLASFVSGSILHISLDVAIAPIDFHERRIILVARDGVNVEEKLLIFDVKPVKAPDVYLLAGQSNMEGTSEDGAKQSFSGGSEARIERIRQLNVRSNSLGVFDQTWKFTDEYANVSEPRYIPAEDPLHEPRAPQRNIKEASFIGLGFSFAKAALVNTTQEIYLVPAAWSATGFCTNELHDGLAWNAEPTPESFLGGTLLADRAITRLNMTLRETGGVFRGILWHQGEADSNNADCAYQYEQNLRKLVSRLRTEALTDARGAQARGANADIPFIAGTMSKGADVRASLENFGALKSHVDSIHRKVADVINHADYVNNDDLIPPAYPCGKGSCIHFGGAAYREMGSRYYQAIQRVHRR